MPAVNDYESVPAPNLQNKAKQMFDNLDDYDDDFDNSMASKANEKDFNANELLNLNSY